MRPIIAAAALILAAGGALAQPVAPGPTLAAVRAKGVLDCGAHPGAPGFGATDSQGVYRGLEADICRAMAAAILGDPAKVRFTVLTSQARLPALQSGQIDVLPRTTTWTQTRDTANGLNFTAVTFFDGQGFLVRKASGAQRAKDLDNATICVTSGTTNELNLTDWGRSTGIRFQPVVFEQPTETVNAYENGRCDALSTDASQLAGIRTGLGRPDDHVVLPDIISKEPLAPSVRHGDDQWFDIIRWTIFALVGAEELGITQANAEAMLKSPNPEIRRLLGEAGDHGPLMGLDRRWAYNAIRAAGNYGEIFDRNLGQASPLKLPRGVNDLWTRGGLMYGMPVR
ncbi:amino acid ABC transporter substrate-binding protein [Paracraurococcus ruber]|uniref:Amino acid ABC transporter substrate-binding protein n=1 Tax=Paracraurococcus ruber TaxID=77675 RepID=A0ABS1CXK6_9PROT|nr:amino acid ABC transporter substrate-binding protein [Paracraurococcus ruber]MBK1658682.1 amino acid ABC transporter substrate-binding protein [Paracraurococcus ruber]TDG31262.1 amino acid ABC transporter substrate-binding protein [Paracraurococcus ruber]